MAQTPHDEHISRAAGSLQEYLRDVPTVMSTGDQDAAERAEAEMYAHLDAARAVRVAGQAE